MAGINAAPIPAPAARRPSPAVLRTLIALVVSALALYLSFRDVSWGDVLAALRGADALFLGIALAALIVGQLARAARWKVLLGKAGDRATHTDLLMAHVVGQLLNYLLPARAGDLSRAVVIGNQGPGKTFVFGTVMVEKMLDSLAYVALFGGLLALAPLPEWIEQPGLSFGLITALVALVVLVVTYRRAWVLHLLSLRLPFVPLRLQEALTARARSGLSSLDVLQNRSDLLKLAAWTALIWLTAVMTNHYVLLALGLRLPLTASVLVLVGVQAGISLPSVPGRVGIFEYICVLALAVYGVSSSLALSYGLVLHALVLTPVVVFGALFLRWQGLGLDRQPRWPRSEGG